MDGRIKDRLLEAAIEQFGAAGFEGASTREIAAAAGATMSAIAYHFGSKDGLLLAVAEHISDGLGARMLPAVATALGGPDAPVKDRATAKDGVLAIVDALAEAMLSRETTRFARFVVREQMSPSPAFEVIYGRVIGKVLSALERLIRISADPGPEEARRTAVTIVGQVIVLQAARASVARALGWSMEGPDETDTMRATLRRNVTAVLESLGSGTA